jgi:hypothetical protein
MERKLLNIFNNDFCVVCYFLLILCCCNALGLAFTYLYIETITITFACFSIDQKSTKVNYEHKRMHNLKSLQINTLIISVVAMRKTLSQSNFLFGGYTFHCIIFNFFTFLNFCFRISHERSSLIAKKIVLVLPLQCLYPRTSCSASQVSQVSPMI